MTRNVNIKGWVVASAALAVNLILGILYSWSIIQRALVTEWGWSNTEASLPYTVCISTFAIIMIFAGRAQDKYGPRPVALLGGILFGTGLILSAFTRNPSLMMLTFGITGGMGIGFGYSAVTPCAIKWFDPSKKGLITGIVVSGVGLSPVYIAPLTNMLLNSYGIQSTFLMLGIPALAGISLLSLVLQNPPGEKYTAGSGGKTASVPAEKNNWQEIKGSPNFILLWATYLMSAAAGLMLIGHLAGIAFIQAGWEAGFVLVIILSVFNAAGRVAGGFLSDRTGRTNALLIVFIIQAANMFMFTWYKSVPLLITGSAIAGLAYGSLFSLFPAATADFFGIRNLGFNYGLVFTGWGVAGIIGPLLAGAVVDSTGSYSLSYVASALMLIVAAILVKRIKPGQTGKQTT